MGTRHSSSSLYLATAKQIKGNFMKTTVLKPLKLISAVTGLLMFTACASVQPPPTSELQAAELAIATAERDRVADYASSQLSDAREKLTAARSAVQKEEMNKALRLAQQARVDAELASALAEVAKAETVNEEMLKGIDTLKQEMQRNTTGDR
jgi:hypothetical protein